MTPEHVTARLAAALAELGYDKVVTVRLKSGDVLSIKFVNTKADGMTTQPNCECYVSDMFPNDKGEAFLCVWNWIGMPGPCRQVAEHLTKRGIKARATTHRKLRGVRFDLGSAP